jgi:serine/threonine protein phosphatase PrpC
MECLLNYGLERIEKLPPETIEKFYLKNGELNAYSFACGYIQKAELRKVSTDHHTSLELWHEGACYHVRAHDHELKGRIFWESFDSLGDARKFFHSELKKLKKGN